MDAYLESLVKKEAAEEIVAEPVEKVVEKPAEEIKEEAVVESVEAEAALEPEVVEIEEAPKEKASEPKKEKIKVKKEEPKKEEPKKAEKKKEEPKQDKTKAPDPSFLEEGKEYDIDLVRVYKTPDTKQMSSTISGRIIFLGKTGTFSIINYMKHGFGLVKGYVEDLESHIK